MVSLFREDGRVDGEVAGELVALGVSVVELQALALGGAGLAVGIRQGENAALVGK